MQSFNLLTESWIPVRRADGTRLSVPPWRIVENVASPELALADIASPRPDFKGALFELLIGLVQTAFAPKDIRQWRQRFDAPPTPNELKSAFDRLIPDFNLFGDRPRFMQDLTLSEKEAKTTTPVAALLMDTPGENAARFNSDIFIKRNEPPNALCPACAAAALYVLQAYAPSGGAGYRVSLRGGGPLTTLIIIPDSLWKTVWANVLPLQGTDAESLPDNPAELPGKVFPWLAPTRESNAKGSEIHRAGMHFLHHYWAMPRRVVLLPEPAGEGFACPVCGLPADVAVRQYLTKNYGNNYGMGWRHPLTPYRDQKPGEDALTLKGVSDRKGYNHWLGLVYGAVDEKLQVRPAKGVAHFRGNTPESLVGIGGLRAYGWDMDNMKPRNWCEGEYPIYDLNGRDPMIFLGDVTPLVKAAEIACSNLKKTVTEALFSEKGQTPKPDATLLSYVQAWFWAKTEKTFYECVRKLLYESQSDISLLELKTNWRDTLLAAVNAVFAAVAEDGGAPPQKARQIYAALNRLRAYTSSGCSKLLGIPVKKEAKK